MTAADQSSPEQSPAAHPPAASGASWSKLAVDFGPVAVFMIVYNIASRMTAPAREACEAASAALGEGQTLAAEAAAACARGEQPIFIATAVFMVATVAALAYAWVKERRVSTLLLVTAALVLTFGGLTMIFRDSIFIKIKPTIINLLYAGAIFGSLMVGQNVIRLFLGNVYKLPTEIWRVLAVRWGAFFVFLALLNEYIWRNFSEAFWANFKFLGMMPLTIAFAMVNVPLILKHHVEDDDAAAS